MNKAVHFKATGQSFGVTSVVVPAGTKGFLYLEAKNEPAVKAAINGLRGVRVNIQHLCNPLCWSFVGMHACTLEWYAFFFRGKKASVVGGRIQSLRIK